MENEGDIWVDQNIEKDLVALSVKETDADKEFDPFTRWVADNIFWLHNHIFKWFKVSSPLSLLAIRERKMRKSENI